ncbi:hypothetical protein [Streptomyces sp. Caat 7-52]|uniref:hypothetical protein n=1 Tax=Streptomyces sp. Caat 7-52 TaxID=2949637 RepID=UPI0020357AFE|nr:hypothetical protein [Streptomyces sp. Caat 7-52]
MTGATHTASPKPPTHPDRFFAAEERDDDLVMLVSCGQTCITVPVASSGGVMRPAGMVPYSPTQRKSFPRATLSMFHQPCWTG